MTKQEQIATAISNSCDRHGYDLSEAEIDLIAMDLLKSGLIAFDNKIPVADIEQGATFKWGKKAYIKLDTFADGCLCLAKNVWFNSEFDDKTNDWSKSQLRGDIARKAASRVPDVNKLMLFDRDLTTDDGLTVYGRCSDSVSMLTCDEYRKYRKYIPETNKWYWTITATTTCDCHVRTVDSDGSLSYDYVYFNQGWVRPLICLDNGTSVEVENE